MTIQIKSPVCIFCNARQSLRSSVWPTWSRRQTLVTSTHWRAASEIKSDRNTFHQSRLNSSSSRTSQKGQHSADLDDLLGSFSPKPPDTPRTHYTRFPAPSPKTIGNFERGRFGESRGSNQSWNARPQRRDTSENAATERQGSNDFGSRWSQAARRERSTPDLTSKRYAKRAANEGFVPGLAVFQSFKTQENSRSRPFRPRNDGRIQGGAAPFKSAQTTTPNNQADESDSPDMTTTDLDAVDLQEPIAHSPVDHEYADSRHGRKKSFRSREPSREDTVAPGRHNARQRARRVVPAMADHLYELDDRGEEAQRRREQRRKAQEDKKARRTNVKVRLPAFVTVSNLAGLLKVQTDHFLAQMDELGFSDLKHDHILDSETAGLIVNEFDFEAVHDESQIEELKPLPPPTNTDELITRPPIVTIMGHVDHGKTTLLDYWRKSAVAASEHGGITQHIGAFSVPMGGGRTVTFLDTPGHAAFLAMRQRGANVTDIIILVVAADDSVMPQTIEAIKHAQAAKVPMIVAINKIDKEDHNLDRVKGDLSRYGVEIEDYGGDTQTIGVSGKTGKGMDELEEATVALADVLDVRATPWGTVEGWVLEASKNRKGTTATVLIRRGTLTPGTIVVAGTAWARVRSMRDAIGFPVAKAGPGTPVEVDGWREQPKAGDEMLETEDEHMARGFIANRLAKAQQCSLVTDVAAVNASRRAEQEKKAQLKKMREAARLTATHDDLWKKNGGQDTTSRSAEGGSEGADDGIDSKEPTPPPPKAREVNLVLKADVSGSLEAVLNSVSSIGNDLIYPKVLRSDIGNVSESDLELAAVAKGHIIAFNTPPGPGMLRAAQNRGVKIIHESIIYRLVDQTRAMLEDMLPPIVSSRVLGEAEVSQVFQINTKGRVLVPFAGCRVRNGVVTKSAKVRVLRGKESVYDGTIDSLKHIKKDVAEMRKGSECGIGFMNWTEFQAGDTIQTYEDVIEKRKL